MRKTDTSNAYAVSAGLACGVMRRPVGRRFSAALMLFAVLAAALCLMVGPVRSAYAIDDGVYQVKASVMHATQAGQTSMGDAAFTNVLEQDGTSEGSSTRLLTLVVRNGEAYLEAQMVPIERKLGNSSLTCYLGYLDYYPDYHGTASPTGQTPTAAMVDSYYPLSGASSDVYNNAKTGTDAALKGQKYPKILSMHLSDDFESHSVLWIRLYIPLMESISKGSGTQYAKIEIDYDSLVEVTDTSQSEKANLIAERHAAAELAGYQNLGNQITAASRQLLDTDIYTEDSLATLRTARNEAQGVYESRTANMFGVVQSVVALSTAQEALVKKSSSSSSASKGKSSSGSDKKSQSTSKSGNSKSPSLDFAHLADGTYTVYGEMIKTDRQQQSMANQAINHNIRIKVKNGTYTVQMTFSAMRYAGKLGAMGQLWYFKSGYKHANGTLSGTRASAKVLSYLTTSKGTKFKDAYGTNYPKTVSFPLISEAKKDGWVPLQVLIPLMEGISEGSGTQSVYLKLHTDSVVSGTRSVSGKSTGTSSKTSSSNSAEEGESGDSTGALPSASESDSEGTLSAGAASDDKEDASADADGAAGVASDDSDGTSGGESADAEGSASNTAQSGSSASAEPEPPLRRYLGLMGGSASAAVACGLGYALIRRRALIAALIGAAH